ncbi:hypothetical protein SSCG_05926 [Streptomyces clavuligerus]|nr:hypothetical protein SSCG_05926 [Streptomyces clavuligerus]
MVGRGHGTASKRGNGRWGAGRFPSGRRRSSGEAGKSGDSSQRMENGATGLSPMGRRRTSSSGGGSGG